MTTREGSLEAPKRLPIDWENPEYYDEPKLFAEMERVFDICHGCRRCVNLCTAFPRLFDLIDEGSTGELDAVEKSRYWEVVDRCYLCDMCSMTKCPYVPPHPWNVDFPHLMLRAKAVKHEKGGTSFRDKLLSSTDAVGKLASIPVVVQAVNAINKAPATRKLMDSMLGIHAERRLPEYDSHRFRKTAQPNADHAVRNGERTPGKVAIYSTCYINYNEPGIGHDLLRYWTITRFQYAWWKKKPVGKCPNWSWVTLQRERTQGKNFPPWQTGGEGKQILGGAARPLSKTEIPSGSRQQN